MATPFTHTDEKSEYPMRINKYLAQKGYSTRRGADELVERQRVFINGQVAELGSKVSENDTVEVRTGKRTVEKKYYYFAYNKGRGVITHSAQKKGRDDDETEISENLPKEASELGLFPVGRLDKDSHGLIILTNDGRITDRLLNPDRVHDKEYAVRVKLMLRESFIKHMENGVNIEGYQTRPCKVRLTGTNSFSITLTEGKKHQIRRMVVAMHNEVVELKRTRVLNIKLGTLKANEIRAIEGTELQEFLELLGLASAPVITE
jgi:23S rRNA pseudouridine2604 synthase